MTFLKNCWYAVAHSGELSHNPLSRTILSTPLVLYRTEAGLPVALNDRCPHRFAPLSEGKVLGDQIRCLYHGLRFAPDGKCADNPCGTGKIPSLAKVTSYSLREVDGIVWLWYGDMAPDESRIVRFDEFGQLDRWAPSEFVLSIAANFMLVSDNLMDLTHAEFLHPTLAKEGYAKRTIASVKQEADTVISISERTNEPIAPFSRLSMGGENAPDRIDRTTKVTWNAPANLRFDMSDRPVGEMFENGSRSVSAHLITPETESSCFYFYKVVRNWLIDSEETGKLYRDGAYKAFNNEDRVMIEAQQRSMRGSTFDELKPVLLETDLGSTLTRRILSSKLKAQGAM